MVNGCDKRTVEHNSDTHGHVPLHGGIAVELGAHEFQLEFVPDTTARKFQAYVFDGHMENFVRVDAASFVVDVTSPEENHTLRFMPVANNATGEKAGDTSLFEARAEWLKATIGFDALLKELTIRGKKFTNIAFRVAVRSGRVVESYDGN